MIQPALVAPCGRGGFEDRFEILVVELRNHRRDQHTDRDAGVGQACASPAGAAAGAAARGSSVRASSRSSVVIDR